MPTWCWSSSSLDSSPDFAWVVDFDRGFVGDVNFNLGKDGLCFVRAMRNGLPGKGLPATGQTRCYGGTEIPCDSVEYPGQDDFYTAGFPNDGRFVDNLDGTVTDNCTGLMWQKDTVDIDGDGTIEYPDDVVPWQQALKNCEGLALAGHTDWRLPNVRELQSIVDYARYDQTIDPVFGALSFWYWSSSTYVGDRSYAWLVGGQTGMVRNDVRKGDLGAIRAVRGGL